METGLAAVKILNQSKVIVEPKIIRSQQSFKNDSNASLLISKTYWPHSKFYGGLYIDGGLMDLPSMVED